MSNDSPIEHGHFEIVIAGPGVVWIHGSESWNLATTERYVRECKLAISTLQPPIARVVDLRHWQYGPPEIIDEIAGLYRWMNERQVVRQIDVLHSQLTKKMHLDKVEVDSTIQFTQADTPEAAMAILRSEGWLIDDEFTAPGSDT